jgi:hypothetical protein
MSFRDGKLYDLLPEVYRVRDVEGRENLPAGNLPLESLLSVLAREVGVVEEDLAQLYDDLFIETCADWVVPYIGDLVGVGGLHELEDAASRRAQVANTVAYRRRKGTAAILEGLARDTTGWPAHAVEFFRVLATTQHPNHVRLSNLGSPDLRRWEPLEYADTPFDELTHTADVRRIASGRGRHNIPNVGVFLWRLGAHSLTLSPAVRVDPTDDRRYRFDPLNKDTQLFTKPRPEPDIAHISKPVNVPMPIGRRVLHEQLKEDPNDYYGAGKSILLVGVYEKTGEPGFRVVEYGPGAVLSCNLGDAEGGQWAHETEQRISVDPVLGRIFFSVDPPEDHELAQLLVTYHYGFGADMGGGEYDRAASIRTGSQTTVRVAMPETRAALEELADDAAEDAGPEPRPSIQEALSDLGGQGGVVEVLDSGRYEETLSIVVGSGQRVELRAADGHRPTVVLSGDLEIEGGSGPDAESEVTLNGLLITGGTLKVSGNLRRLRLLHCTLVPGIGLEPDGEPGEGSEPSLRIEPDEAGGVEVVEVDRCILGGLRVTEGSEVRITDSILDATDSTGVAYAAPDGEGAGGRLRVENSTIIGKVHTREIGLASNTIFLADLAEDDDWEAPVHCERLQEGCVRFSYLPLDSRAPRRHRCRPESEAEAGRVRPQFTSLRYGDPGYCQLGGLCAGEIRRGADDESEMGAFHDLHAPQREANLRARLEEYLRFGLEAGILYAT